LIFSQLPDGRPAITIPVRGNKMEFKITRGGWNKVEVDKSGQEIENRILYLGFSDSIHLDIARWRDKGGDY
jgi:hypothetical protein